MSKPITNHAVQAIAFILLCQNGFDDVDACMALADGKVARQMARAAEEEAAAINAANDIAAKGMPSNWVGYRTNAYRVLKSGWIPDGWQS